MSTPASEVFNEDCMIGMPRYPDKFFDLAIVDPPYFKGVGKMGYFGKSKSSVGVPRGRYAIPDWDQQIPSDRYLTELLRVSKHQIIWGINYFKFFHCAGRIVWDKVNGDSPFSDAEIASCSLIETVRIFRYMWNGMSQAKSISEGETMQGNKKLNEKRIHPTQKPIALYRWLLAKYGNGGGVYPRYPRRQSIQPDSGLRDGLQLHRLRTRSRLFYWRKQALCGTNRAGAFIFRSFPLFRRPRILNPAFLT